MRYYVLDGHTPIPVEDALIWAFYMALADRRVAYSEIGPLQISTVFLGLNHNYFNEGPPLLFETMIFGFDEHDGYQTRSATWDEAERQHALAFDIAETLVRQSELSFANFMARFHQQSEDNC